MQTITLLILSYNTREITLEGVRKALDSMRYCEQHNKESTFSLLVVDNASSDGTVAAIRKQFPQVKVLALPENVGTSRGNNAGMKQITSDFIVLLNSDTYLEPDTLYKSLAYLNTHPSCDMMVCRLVNEKGEFDPDGGHTPTPLRILLWSLGFESIPFLNKFFPHIYGYPRSFYQKPFRAEWMSACFYFLRRNVYDKTGGMDENIFMYMDDIEWAKRIKDAGFQIWFNPKVQAVHLGGASSVQKGQVQKVTKSQFEGMTYFIKKHYPKQAKRTFAMMKFGFRLRGILFFLLGQKEKAHIYLTIS